MTDVLAATGITHRYPRTRRHTAAVQAVPALDDVSFHVGAGETVGIVGRSGSGKSTLLTTLLALGRPDEGTVTLAGRPVQLGSVRRLRWFRRRVQYVPQDPGASLDPRMTVEQLVREPLKRLDVPGDHRTLVRAALDDVSLDTGLSDRRPRELSGGQAQRVAIARALATNPDFLLADEPISGLDLPMRNHVIGLLAALADERSFGLVFISHDLDAVARMCQRSVVLSHGRIVEEGDTRLLFAAPTHPATQELVDSIPRLPEVRAK